MKVLLLLALLPALVGCSAFAAENSSPDSAPFADRSGRNANVSTMMSVTDTMSTTVVPRCKAHEIQIVSGASVRFNSQGGPVTASSGGLRIVTGETYSEENETTTRISAVVTDGITSTIIIISKY